MGTVGPMRLTKPSTLTAALTATAVLAGCGGSSTVTASKYVSSVCSAVAPFERDVLNRSDALDLTSVKSPVQGKQALEGFLTAITNDTSTAVSKLKSAGTPNVKNGKQISNAITGAFTQLQTAMNRAARQAKALPTTDATSFKNGATSLGNQVRTSMNSIGSNLQSSTLKSPELQQAAAKEQSCKSIGS